MTIISLGSRYLALSAFLGMLAFALTAGPATSRAEERTLTIYNIHTKETVTATFKRDGKFLDDGLKQINHVMRDWRRNEPTKMDPALVDLIWDIHRELGSKQPVHLISGYRSPRTNAMLRKSRGGQAKFSRHMAGQAADIHFPDIPLKEMRNSALIRERGGVGFYPRSGIPFVHVDTGNVRHWPRLPRQELALLFPSGRSKHVPADGRPITREDHRVALASLQQRGGDLPWALRKTKPQTVLASLGPTTLPTFGLTGERAPESSATEPLRKKALAPLEKPGSLAAPGIIPARLSPALPPEPSGGDYGLAEEGEEHEDEMLFEPLPIIELLTDTPLSHIEISEEERPPFKKTHLLLSAPSALMRPEFEEGLQIENLYAARRFDGPAISLVQNVAWAKRLAGAASEPAKPTRTAAKSPPR